VPKLQSQVIKKAVGLVADVPYPPNVSAAVTSTAMWKRLLAAASSMKLGEFMLYLPLNRASKALQAQISLLFAQSLCLSCSFVQDTS
jgi:hypothetical protein